ncbi:MAG TPA: alpha/beta fold hydrolase [Solirubrobacteraceae bacterium]|jgi:dienelactone hydrolase
MRSEVTFDCDGMRCAAWLYVPHDASSAACVVLADGFGCVRRFRLHAYAERFATAGLCVLAFDYRHFGDSEGSPRQLLDIDLQLADWRAAVAYARKLPFIDATRVALWGTSLSGGHVLAIAAQDEGIAAVVAQMPFSGGWQAARASGARLALRLTAAALRDQLRGFTGRPPYYVPIYGPPGSLAALTVAGAEHHFTSLSGMNFALDNRYTPRVGLRLTRYAPSRLLRQVRCPVLVCIGTHGNPKLTERAILAAQRSPHVELMQYPADRFGIYLGEVFQRAALDQAHFLAQHLSPRRSP